MKTVCLNMIVCNESAVIRRCLASVKDKIDAWVIVDTGSTDGTQEIIKEYLKDIPGELHERPWVDFAEGRNQAMELAKGKADYLLFIDADEILEAGSEWEELTQDSYFINVFYDKGLHLKVEHPRTFLLNNALDWIWVGVLHEQVEHRDGKKRSQVLLDKARLHSIEDGYRSKDSLEQKAIKDSATLEKALEKEPTNTRYIYFLGQSYDVAQRVELALKQYQKLMTMPDVHEALLYMSMIRSALLQEQLERPVETVIESYMAAYQRFPWRAEPLFHLANFYMRGKRTFLAYFIAKTALSIPIPQFDAAPVYTEIYKHYLPWVFAKCAARLGLDHEANEMCSRLLARPDLPPEVRRLVDEVHDQESFDGIPLTYR
ncbi:MAG: glycosyltransferase [Chlamydiales bacterium]|nr:glycosyltransferase [Chlamydiales bacterium]